MPVVGGRAGEYAGWWIGGPNVIDITAVSSVTQAIYQTPSYGIQVINGAFDPIEPRGIIDSSVPSDSYCNISTISSAATFNNSRGTFVCTVKPTANGNNIAYAGGTASFNDNNGDGTTFSTYIGTNAGGNTEVTFNLNGNQQTLNLGPYATYNNKWLTIVFATAETSSAFTNWSTTSPSGNVYLRSAVYNTETASLITKTDWISTIAMANILNVSSNQVRVDYGGLGTRTYIQLDCSGSSDLGNNYPTFAGCWYGFGTMFDPVGSTDTTWLTTRPSAQIGNGIAWFNGEFAGNTQAGGYYYVAESDMDLYTNIDSIKAGAQLGAGGGASNGWTSAQWANASSTTNIPKDRS